MKKIFALILAVMMIATMSTTAFAATNEGGDTTINIKGTFIGNGGAGDKISVDIAWEGMVFTYTEGAAGEWLPGEHKYAEDDEGTWSTNKGTITVTNHSNTGVTATLSFASAVNGVNGTFSKNSLTLASAANGESLGDVTKAPKDTVEFGISGAAITETKDTLGTITVKIAAAN